MGKELKKVCDKKGATLVYFEELFFADGERFQIGLESEKQELTDCEKSKH